MLAGRVLCVGVAVFDNIFAIEAFPPEPTKVFARDFTQVGGGPAANAAVTVSRLGGEASLWARVGEDQVGARIINEIEEYGVDVSYMRRIPGRRSGVSAVMVDRNGERLIAAFADRELDTDSSWLPLDRIHEFDVVLGDVRWPAASERALRAASEQGIKTVLDADLTTDDAVDRLIHFADYAVFSAPALRRLSGEEEVEAGLVCAQERTEGMVGVTLGSRGFAWLESGQLRQTPSFPVEAVDTLAAGDVFHGAFALGIAEHLSLEETSRFAAAAAALKCTRWGGRAGIPNRSELDAFLSAQSSAGNNKGRAINTLMNPAH
jgi:sulfofructose kinase